MTTITARPFFMTDAGLATLYTLQNTGGMEVSATDFGGHITNIRVPDRNGAFADVVLAYDDEIGYHARTYYLGAAVGRCANRIAEGKFTLNNKTYQLACNNGRHHLHGGVCGFDQKQWHAEIIESKAGQALRLSMTSPDGDEGYPGNLKVVMVYTLSDDQALTVRYEAVSDADTVCNLTNHTYFNLAGHNSGTILSQKIKIYADQFTEGDAENIPTGRILPVEGTPMDFRTFHAIGERIGEKDQQLLFSNGYDHNWVLHERKKIPTLCAEAYDPASGRHLSCLTTCPGMQLYTGNFINGTERGKENCYYRKNAGFCFETQYPPDSVNHPEWENAILRAGEKYNQTTIYRFDAQPLDAK